MPRSITEKNPSNYFVTLISMMIKEIAPNFFQPTKNTSKRRQQLKSSDHVFEVVTFSKRKKEEAPCSLGRQNKKSNCKLHDPLIFFHQSKNQFRCENAAKRNLVGNPEMDNVANKKQKKSKLLQPCKYVISTALSEYIYLYVRYKSHLKCMLGAMHETIL